MSATWARLRLGRVYHRALSLALSTASTAPTEGSSAPEGHLSDTAPLARAPHVRTSCVDLCSSERLVPAHGTHAESWAYRGGHLPEGALASAAAPHEEPGCALLASLPAPQGKADVAASGIKLQSKKTTEETQPRLTIEEEGLESNVKVKLLPAKTTAVDSKVSNGKPFLGIKPKSADVKPPAIKEAEGTRVQSLIPEDPASDVWSYVETNPVAKHQFPTQSDGHELDSGSVKSAHSADGTNAQLNKTEYVVISQFSNVKTLGSGSSLLSSKDSGFHGINLDLLSKKSTLEASDPSTDKSENKEAGLKEHVVLPIANSSHLFASVANVCGSGSSASESFTPICELILESDSDSTISTSRSTSPELNLAITTPSNDLDSKADSHTPSDSKAAVVASAGSCLEPTFKPPPPPPLPPPMPPL